MKTAWEPIDDCTDRLSVPEGWIVRSTTWAYMREHKISVHQVFIQDCNHLWKITDE